MTTNDEIVNQTDWIKSAHIIKDNKAILTLNIDLNNLLNEARADERRKVLDEKWQADKKRIAKQIFEEMDKYKIWYCSTCSRISHTGEPEKNHRWVMKVELTSGECQALKKKYEVD